MLAKTSSLALVDPGRPGIPGQPARDFVMFAPPSPKGYMYNSKNAPAAVDQFAHGNWTPLVAAPSAPVGADSNPFDYKAYVSLAEWNAYALKVYGHVLSPSYNPIEWVAVTDQSSNLVGWQRIAPPPARQTSDWYGPIANMVYITFPNATCDPNGHPVSGLSKADGYYDYDGTRYWGTFHNTNGVWYKVAGDPLPPGAVYKNGITACPAVAAVPSVPYVAPTYRADLHPGWNAGANSVATHSANLKAVFTPNLSSVEAVGLYAAPDAFSRVVADYKTLDFAFLVYPNRYEIIERGVRVSNGAAADSATTSFEIQRVDGVVTYSVGGSVVYTSNRLSAGPLRVGAAIYSAPDGVF